MKTKKLKSLLCLIFSITLIFSALNYPERASAAPTIDEIRQQQKKLDEKIAAANARIAELKKDIAKQKEYAAELQGQIDDFQGQIDLLKKEIAILQGEIDVLQAKIDEKTAQIEALNAEILELEEEIVRCEEEIARTKEQLKARLRSLYINGETSSLELLLSADSFTNFLVRLELMDNIAKHDSALIDSIRALAEKLDSDIKKLEQSKAALEEVKLQLAQEQSEFISQKNDIDAKKREEEAKLNEIKSKWNEIQRVLDNLFANDEAYRNTIKKAEQEKADYDKKIVELLNQQGSSGSGALPSSGFISPLDYSTGGFYVSSRYGQRSSGFHEGVDITKGGATGTPIRAVADGKVVSAEYHGSWGNNVLIDHGNGVATRYAHCNVMTVSAGAQVKQGQTIGTIGNTGNSTGPHLHFEVYINGKRVNPEPYIQLPK